jgi:hypothetical protein
VARTSIAGEIFVAASTVLSTRGLVPPKVGLDMKSLDHTSFDLEGGARSILYLGWAGTADREYR